VDAVVVQAMFIRTETVKDTGKDARGLHRFDICFDNLPQLLGNGPSCLSERERFGRVKVEEDAGENRTEDHEHFVLGKDAARIFLRLQGQSKYIRGEVHMGKVANTIRKSVNPPRAMGSGELTPW
jgi:hypothetical protein